MRDIATQADIAVSGLYTYANSKQDMLYKILDALMRRVHEETKLALEGVEGPLERLRTFIYRLARTTAERYRDSTILEREIRSLEPKRRRRIIQKRDAYESILRDILKEAEAAGYLSRSTPKESKLTAFALLGMCTSISGWYRPERGSFTPDEIAKQYAQLALTMIAGLGEEKTGSVVGRDVATVMEGLR